MPSIVINCLVPGMSNTVYAGTSTPVLHLRQTTGIQLRRTHNITFNVLIFLTCGRAYRSYDHELCIVYVSTETLNRPNFECGEWEAPPNIKANLTVRERHDAQK